VSDLQPWRNPRPAPHLPEVKPRLTRLLIPSWLRSWWPALIWAAVIFSLSTNGFSSDHTASVFARVLRWLFPALTAHQFDVVHYYIRKSAHFVEYFIFAMFLYRAVRGARQGWRWTWGLAALSVAAGYSALDEIHQAFVAGRTASAYDSLLDSIGAFFAISALYFWFRLRPTKATH
jgi:VanZ family protein